MKLFVIDVTGTIDLPNDIMLIGLTEEQWRALDQSFATVPDELKQRFREGFQKCPRIADFPAIRKLIQ